MLRSVRAGGLAAAAFVTAVLGATAPAQAQVANATSAIVQPAVAAAPAAAPAAIPQAAPAAAAVVEQAATVPAAPAAAAAVVPASAATVVDPATPAAPAAAAPVAADPVGAPPAPVASAMKRSLAELATTLAATEVTDADHECLANAVYFEARGEPLAGQLAVAEVVLNRARSGRYPPDVCAVVKQPWQFSFVRHGQFPRADRSSDAWRRAVAIARVAREKLHAELPQNVLWYHATYVAPDWGKRLTRKAKIGLHIFYS